MGHHKAAMQVGGTASAERIAALLSTLDGPACEVGPGWSPLPLAAEDRPGTGPLTAIAAGWRWLRSAGHEGAALVLACDLPLLDERAVAWLAGRPGTRSVFPVIDGEPQWLCGRWSTADLDHATTLAEHGLRAVHRALEGRDLELVPEPEWTSALAPDAFHDANTPETLTRLLSDHPNPNPRMP